MGHASRCILRVAIPSPLRRVFDYLPPDNQTPEELRPGMRVRVPFGGRKECIGLLLSISEKTEVPFSKLRNVIQIIDDEPLIPKHHLALLEWASRYYQHPIGEVVFNAFPGSIRQGKASLYPAKTVVQISDDTSRKESLNRAIKQKNLYQKFVECKIAIDYDTIKKWDEYTPASLKALLDKDLVKKETVHEKIVSAQKNTFKIKLPKSTPQQQKVIDAIYKKAERFNCFLLNGITGSGKTQVYMEIIARTIQSGQQALVLIPEIGLTPQFIQRFQDTFNTGIALYHSGLSEQERFSTWLRARDQSVSIIIGTRSAVWLNLKNPGIIIVDEEHDLSYKQQDGFRYSARDIAIYRAQKEKIPIILGTATPSMESLQNVARSQYQQLQLTERIGDARLPEMQLIDLKAQAMTGALSETLIDAMRSTLKQNQQVLLFINRRGFSPAILCHNCAYVIHCNRCDKTMTYHKQKKIIWCHHCDRQLSIDTPCPECNAQDWAEIGHGTERIEEDIKTCFPDYNVVRIDRDSTRRKGKLDEYLNSIHSGEANILIGTQMLAKGHHFPALAMVGILDVDGGLYSTDFRASERMAQLLIQVSGRAGRTIDSGRVYIQTHHPDHPLLNSLIKDGYDSFSKLLLKDRDETQLPPFSYFALLRAEAHNRSALETFLKQAKNSLLSLQNKLEIYGPVVSPLQRRAGRYRMQLLVQAKNRSLLGKYLTPWLQQLEQLKSSRAVRWGLDVDPQDMM